MFMLNELLVLLFIMENKIILLKFWFLSVVVNIVIVVLIVIFLLIFILDLGD